MRKRLFGLLLATAASVAYVSLSSASLLDANRAPAAPAFTETDAEDWINSAPLSWADLNGQVVLLDFWTFGCWNCYRSFPWLNELRAELAEQPFTTIGVHSPEFEHEKDLNRIKAKMKEFGLDHPVMVDNDMRTWRAFENRYWPAWYIIDKQGRLRSLHIGEIHSGTKQAQAIEADIRRLLAE